MTEAQGIELLLIGFILGVLATLSLWAIFDSMRD